ncbi:DUF1279 superfamily [Malassezia pachydermatis]
MLARPNMVRALMTRGLPLNMVPQVAAPLTLGSRATRLPTPPLFHGRMDRLPLSAQRTYSSSSGQPAPHIPNASSHKSSENGNSEGPKEKQGFFGRFRSTMKRYGWWALGVYTGLSFIDCMATFAAIHFYASEQVDDLEALLSKWLGPIMKKLKKEDPQEKQESAILNYVKKLFVEEKPEKSHDVEQLFARISTEFVLAYAIHKTILLPFRAGLTAMITPSIVRALARRGWIRPIKEATAKMT